MTRAHARLLGPCFKTGPVSARNKTTADRDASRPSNTADAPHAMETIKTASINRDRHLQRFREEDLKGSDAAASWTPKGGREPRSLPSKASHDTAAPSSGEDGTTAGAFDRLLNGSQCFTKGEVHALRKSATTHDPSQTNLQSSSTPRTPGRTMSLPVRSFEFHRFTPDRFHVLLNSLFKVLFNFPSRYLFAIGLVVVFSLRWSLPPA
jgi:hypothetical protein